LLRLVQWLAACTIGVSLSVMLHGKARVAEGHRFSVRDSIVLTAAFSDPSIRDPLAVAKFSTDRKHFGVLSTRGPVASHEIDSTVWAFGIKVASEYIRSSEATQTAAPKRVAGNRAIPQAQRRDLYGALITALIWSASSRNILFLSANAQSHRHASVQVFNRRFRAPLVCDYQRGYALASIEIATSP
jgi:hypothetical protein